MDTRGGRATSGAARLEDGQTFDLPETKTDRVSNSQATELLEPTRAEDEEVTNMHDEDLKLIRQIVASDGRKYTAGNIAADTTGWSTWDG